MRRRLLALRTPGLVAKEGIGLLPRAVLRGPPFRGEPGRVVLGSRGAALPDAHLELLAGVAVVCRLVLADELLLQALAAQRVAGGHVHALAVLAQAAREILGHLVAFHDRAASVRGVVREGRERRKRQDREQQAKSLHDPLEHGRPRRVPDPKPLIAWTKRAGSGILPPFTASAAMTRIAATYRIRAPRSRIEHAARALALEQSVEVPLEAVRDPFVADVVVGRVGTITEIAPDVFDVAVSLAEITTGGDAAQTVNMLFGNSSLHEHVELVDAEFPAALAARFGGPRFGIAGLRERLGVHGRPLTCAAIKPQGLPSAKLAEVCETFARGGIDVIKDDHGLADQSYSPFAERVRACQRAVDRVARETGRRILYAPSLVGSPRALVERARIVRDEGVGMVLLAPALIGLPVFHELVREHLEVPVLAHPAYAGAARVAPPFLLGKLFRLLGADAVIYPSYGGRFSYPEPLCRAIAAAARGALHDARPALPVPAGGMTVERVPELVRCYGQDAMLLIGGSLLVADDVAARTREFVAAVAAGGAA